MSTQEIDLIALIEKDLGPGRRSGRWTVFHCPFHSPDRHPSFAVTNGDGARGPYWRCFSAACGKHGGPVKWLMESRQLSYSEALHSLGGDLGMGARITPAVDRLNEPDYPPGLKWQDRAWRLIQWASDNLWEEPGGWLIDWPVVDQVTGEVGIQQVSALDWLLARGLTEQTLKFWKIGYIPAGPNGWGWHENAEKWGLSGERISMLHGILIPCFAGDEVWYLKIRQPMLKPNKYRQIRGGQPALYLSQSLEGQETVIFCEGELDALLLWQEAGELAGVVTLGSAGSALNSATWGLHLIHTRRRFTAYHADAAGKEGQQKLDWLHPERLEIPQIRPNDKDLTDFHRAGGDLQEWAKNALYRPQEALQGAAVAV